MRRGTPEPPPYCGRLWFKWAGAEPERFAASVLDRHDVEVVRVTTRNLATEYGILVTLPFVHALAASGPSWEAAMLTLRDELVECRRTRFADRGRRRLEEEEVPAIVHELRQSARDFHQDPAREAGALYVFGTFAKVIWAGTSPEPVASALEGTSARSVFTEPLTVDGGRAFFARGDDGWTFTASTCAVLPRGANVAEALVRATSAGADTDLTLAGDAVDVSRCLCVRKDAKARAELASIFERRGAADPFSADRKLALVLGKRCER